MSLCYRPLDLAVLQIDTEVTCAPATYSGCSQAHIRISPGPSLPVPLQLEAWLPVSEACRLKAGEELVWLLGYPRHAASIMVDHKLVSSIKNGCYQIDSTNTAWSGMSGGPALTADGKVIAILHGDSQGLSLYRDISLYPQYDQLLPSSLLSSPSAGPMTPCTPVNEQGTLGSSQLKGLSFKTRIEALEKKIFEDAAAQAESHTLRERVSSLEASIFGKEQAGSLETRVAALEKEVG